MRTAVQLGTLRGASDAIPDLLDHVAAAGFDGVVFAGLSAAHLKPVAEAIGRTGLSPVAAQVPLDELQGSRPRVVRELKVVGCERVVLPPLHADHFEDEDGVARMATRLSALGGRLAADGRQLCYRNGADDFAALDGGFDLLADHSGDGLAFALDAAAVAAGGGDPAAVVERVAGRVPLVAVPASADADGIDTEAVVGAAREAATEWLVYRPGERGRPPLAEVADRLDSLVG